MKKITKLFRLLEVTRDQPQYGYVLSGVSKYDLSDLAQHHYLVSMIAWRLARIVKNEGGKINIERVLEYALMHDLGEIFGGDIAMPYARANPSAKASANQFEKNNLHYLSTFFETDEKYFQKLAKGIMEPDTDEALIAKVADYIEVAHYKIHRKFFTKGDLAMATDKINEKISKLSDKKARDTLKKLTARWERELRKGNFSELFEESKL